MFTVIISYENPDQQLLIEGLGPEAARGMVFDALTGEMKSLEGRSVTSVEVKPWKPRVSGLESHLSVA